MASIHRTARCFVIINYRLQIIKFKGFVLDRLMTSHFGGLQPVSSSMSAIADKRQFAYDH